MYNFLTVGFDCSPASALRGLNLRSEALPFDWVVSNISSLDKCFQDNFMKYHTNLKLDHSKTRLIDEYGFMFPHDYPLMDINKNTVDVTIDIIGEGIIGEEKNKIIKENGNWNDIEIWKKYINLVILNNNKIIFVDQLR